MGWIALIIIALLGNLYIFSGYDVEGDLAVFMVGIGLLFDVFLIFCVVKVIYAKIRSSIQQEKERRIAEEKRIQQEKIDAEKRRIAHLMDQISQIVNRYKPKEVMWVPLGQPGYFKPELINQDVLNLVRQYKRGISDLIGKYREINSRISFIIECSGIEALEHKLEYLRMNESTLSELKTESDQVYREIHSRKIQLLNEDSYVSSILYKAFELLKGSKRCLSEKINIADFVVDKKPKDLDLFLYRCNPVILSFNDFYYCLFSRVILVFDSNGHFSTALDPTAITISVERKTTNVCADDVTIIIAGVPIVFNTCSPSAAERLPYAGIEYSQKYNHLHNPTSDLIGLLKYVSGAGNDEIAVELERAYGRIKKNDNYFCKEVCI